MRVVSELKKDWIVATRMEKVRFISVIVGELCCGFMGIYASVLFALSVKGDTDYRYLIFVATLLVTMWWIATIKLRPAGRVKEDDKTD